MDDDAFPGYVAGRLAQAGLRQVDVFLAIGEPDPGLLGEAAERSRGLCAEALRAAIATRDVVAQANGPGAGPG